MCFDRKDVLRYDNLKKTIERSLYLFLLSVGRQSYIGFELQNKKEEFIRCEG